MGQHGWGNTRTSDCIEAVHRALDLGIDFFDTADVYGLGVSESILGRALSNRSHSAVIASKFGVRHVEGRTFYDNSPEQIEASLDQSLTRLRRDYIDLYQVHYWDGTTSLADVFLTLERLKEKGKIRSYGVTNIDLSPFMSDLPSGLVSFSFECSLANRKFEGLIDSLHAAAPMTFLSWGTLGQGILSGKYSQETRFAADDRRNREAYVNFHGEKLQKNLNIVEQLRKIQKNKYPRRSLAQLAIRWVLDRFPASVALVGIKRTEQLTDGAGALGWCLDEDDFLAMELVSRF